MLGWRGALRWKSFEDDEGKGGDSDYGERPQVFEDFFSNRTEEGFQLVVNTGS